MKKGLLWMVLVIVFTACGEEKLFIPKPRSFPKIEFPAEKKYSDFDESYCSFGFRYPEDVEVKQDKYFFDGKPVHPCWFDLNRKLFNSTIHCSYYPVDGRKSLDDLVNDAYKLAGKHNVKAEFYEETVLDLPGNVKGVLFEIEGDVATPLQFFLTDSTDHFFRASLYFNNSVNPDSIAPILDYVKTDIDTLLESFYWN